MNSTNSVGSEFIAIAARFQKEQDKFNLLFMPFICYIFHDFRIKYFITINKVIFDKSNSTLFYLPLVIKTYVEIMQ